MAGTVVNINQGTQTGIANDSVGGTMYQTIKLDIGAAGASSLFTGTLPSVTSVGTILGIGGTMAVDLVGTEPIVVQVGTINSATVNTGTVDLLKAGTITRVEGGTIGNLVSGTINSATVTGNVGISSGTVNVSTISSLPNIPGGSIVITTGTIVPHAVTAATITAGTLNLATIAGTVATTADAIVNGTTSTTTTLAAGGTWTGGTVDLLGYNTVRLSAFSDVDSAANGMKLRFSNDGTNWDITRQTTLTGNLGVYAAFNRVARYYSPQYINGAGSQGVFRLQTILTPNSPEFTRRFLSEVPVSSNAGLITQSNIFGTSTAGGGSFVQVKVAPSGAMQVGGAVDISSGTQQTLGTVGVVSAITTGSIVVTTGTIAAHAITAATITEGTLRNLISGTINSATAVLNSGTINVATAVITTLPNLPQGSIQVTAGTITHGTIDIGTVKLDGRAARNILSYGTTFGGTAAAYATLVGSASVGAGTSIWVNDISLTNPSGNLTCLVGLGTALNGTSVLLKGTFGTTSAVGIEKDFPLAVNAGMTNQDLVAYISGAGTIDVNVSYFISA